MAEKVKVKVEEAPEGEGNTLLAMAHKVLLAGIGAVALTQEEVEKFVAKLIERGEIAEKDGKKLVQDVKVKRQKETKKAEGELDKRLEVLLERMNVPSKSDIDALSGKITALTKKVDELKKAQSE